MKKVVDPMFVEYARTAPLHDLRAYLKYAQAHMEEYDITTTAIVREMVAYDAILFEAIAPPVGSRTKAGSTAAQKRHVWNLISRFKSSIPHWYQFSAAAMAADPTRAIRFSEEGHDVSHENAA